MQPQKVPQTGLIFRSPRPSDFIASGMTGIIYKERVSDGKWDTYEPSREPQSTPTFDTLSCTTFSALNTIETQFNFLIKNNFLPQSHLDFLKKEGYLDADGMVNFSDRFSAIMSGTTPLGNDFLSVWDSLRRDGLLPDKDLPFGGEDWYSYHNKALIDDFMRAKAKRFLIYFSLQYEWVFFNGDPVLSPLETDEIERGLKQAPLHIGIPFPAGHAIELLAINENKSIHIFDTYPPYDVQSLFNMPIHFALKGYLDIKPRPSHDFNRNLSKGMRDIDVQWLQKCLNTDSETQVASTGVGSPASETTIFGPMTELAVMKFQRKYKIEPISGYVGTKTRKLLNLMFGASTAPETSTGGKIDAWCEAIKSREGFYAPGQDPDYPNGTAAWRNNNPGNLRYHTIYKRAIGQDASGFCKFKTYTDGYAELRDKLIRHCTTVSDSYYPTMTLLQFYKAYAPSSDGNNPLSYAREVANKLGVDITTQIKDLL